MGKRYLVRCLTLGFIMGAIYFVMEGFWRGWTNIAMLFVGGICGVLVGLLNQHTKLSVLEQCLAGTHIVLVVEFLAGLILNVWLKLHIWDYSNIPGNIYGQVCLQYSLLWFTLIPFAIWLDDWLRYKLYRQQKPGKWYCNYQKLTSELRTLIRSFFNSQK